MSKFLFSILFGALSIVGLSACGKSTGPTGSCNYTQAGVTICADYSGMSSADSTAAQSDCSRASGTWTSSACATANRVGSCAVSAGAAAPAATLRFYSPATTSIGQTVCTGLSGTWTAN